MKDVIGRLNQEAIRKQMASQEKRRKLNVINKYGGNKQMEMKLLDSYNAMPPPGQLMRTLDYTAQPQDRTQQVTPLINIKQNNNLINHIQTRNNSLDAAMDRSYDKRSGNGSTGGRNSQGSYYSPKSGYPSISPKNSQTRNYMKNKKKGAGLFQTKNMMRMQ